MLAENFRPIPRRPYPCQIGTDTLPRLGDLGISRKDLKISRNRAKKLKKNRIIIQNHRYRNKRQLLRYLLSLHPLETSKKQNKSFISRICGGVYDLEAYVHFFEPKSLSFMKNPDHRSLFILL